MIKLKINPLGSKTIDIAFCENEDLKQLLKRALKENEYSTSKEMLEHFAVIVNGHPVNRDLWTHVKVEEDSEILLSTVPKSGDFGETFKQIAILAVVAVVSAKAGPAYGQVVGGLLAAGAGFATSQLLNALIPPPVPAGSNIGGYNPSNLSDSQMYSVTSQSNTVNKYGFVPKVYGSHRMFPYIAANPYTEIIADPDTGELLQYFYAIYDFGLGPAMVSDLRIGDTPIEEFEDVTARLVDPNRPATNEGDWDNVLSDKFTMYKGDIQQEDIGVALNEDRVDNGPIDGYQLVRNASNLVQGSEQEITVNFVTPNGFYSYNTSGDRGKTSVDFNIEYSKVDEDNWIPYDDEATVESFQTSGGDRIENPYDSQPMNMYPREFTSSIGEWNYGFENYDEVYYLFGDTPSYDPVSDSLRKMRFTAFGYKAGATSFLASTGPDVIKENARIEINGVFFGNVGSSAAEGDYYRHTLKEASTVDVILFYSTIGAGSATEPPQWVGEIEPGFGDNMLSVSAHYYSSGRMRISASNSSPVYASVKFTPKAIDEYKVRIVRVKTSSEYNYQIVKNVSVLNLVTRFSRDPVITDKRHTFLELKIKATNQLSGNITNLSGKVGGVVNVYDDVAGTWSKDISSNPAWIYADLMTGPVNKRPLELDRLDTETLTAWADFCDEVPTPPTGYSYTFPRFSCNFVLDFETTLHSMVEKVCNSAQASLNIVDGKYGVLVDRLQSTPVQIFTPRNSWDFSSARKYLDVPHYLKVKYVDPNSDWNVIEEIVYDDGYGETNAETFDELDTFAVTNPEQAWRFGRYSLAQGRLRQENMSINVDFEYMVCTRGDYVQISQDVMRVGGRPARVSSVIGNEITIDDAFITQPSTDYGYTHRSATGSITTSTMTIIDSKTATVDGIIPAVGDLIIWGVVGSITYDCLVKSIEPMSDLTATLILVEKADAIYEAESTDSFPVYSPQISGTLDTELVAPPAIENLAVSENSYRCTGYSYEYYIDLTWSIPTGAAYDKFEIYADYGNGLAIDGYADDPRYRYIIKDGNVGIEHKFKVLAVSANGKKVSLGEAIQVEETPESKTTPPSDVDGLFLNVTGEVLQIDWDAIDDCDCNEYFIRYSPTTTGTWEGSIPLLRTDRNTTLASTQARTGTYLIKAVDFNGNESDNAALAITSIPELFNLNIIEETNDFPALPGTRFQTEKVGSALLLQTIVSGGVDTNEFYSSGYYYYQNFLDLGEIYTVRLQSLIQAEGFTESDIIANWVTLADVAALTSSRFSEWNVETQYRSTEQVNVIANWATLSSIDPIGEGNQEIWTEWRRFTIGDFTGRTFQFRLKLLSNKPSVSPRVFDGVIRADMADRIESGDNLTATPSGYTVTYSTPFKGPGFTPAVQITQDNAQTGDYVAISSKNLDGFTVTFYDKNDTAVTRTFDWQAKGYGRKSGSVI